MQADILFAWLMGCCAVGQHCVHFCSWKRRLLISCYLKISDACPIYSLGVLQCRKRLQLYPQQVYYSFVGSVLLASGLWFALRPRSWGIVDVLNCISPDSFYFIITASELVFNIILQIRLSLYPSSFIFSLLSSVSLDLILFKLHLSQDCEV